VRLRPSKGPKAVVRRVPHQGLQPQSNGVGIRGRSTRQLRLFDELVVDVEGLLHTDNYTIIVWLIEPYHSGLTWWRRALTALAAFEEQVSTRVTASDLKGFDAVLCAMAAIPRRRLGLEVHDDHLASGIQHALHERDEARELIKEKWLLR